MSKSMDLSIKLKLIDKLTEPARRAQKALGGTGTALNKLQANLKDTKAQQAQIVGLRDTHKNLIKNQQAIHRLSKKLKIKGKLTELETEKLKKLKEVGRRYSKTLKAQSMALNKAGIATKNLTAAEARLNARQDTTAKKIEQVNTKLKRTIALRKKLSKMQKGLAIRGAASLAGGLVAGRAEAGFFSPAVNFEQAMARVRGLKMLEKTSEQFKQLKKQAKELGRTTTFTATQVADGQSKLAMAGLTANEIVAAMPAVLDLSKGAALDFGTTADIASNQMTAFNLEAKDMRMIADTLVATMTRSNVTLEMLGETMSYVAPIAAETGASIQEVAAMAGLLGNIGIQGGQAGTALRALYTRMAAPPKPAQEAFGKLNIQTKDLDGNLRSVIEILSEVSDKTKTMGSAERLEIFKGVAGLRAIGGAAGLAKQAGLGEIAKFAEIINKATGEALKLRKIQEDTLGGDLEKMKSAWQGLSIESLMENNNALRENIQSITKLIGSIIAWVKKNPELSATIIKITAVISALLIPLGLLAITIGVIGFKVFLIVAAITAVAAAAYLIYDNWDGISDYFANMWHGIERLFNFGMMLIVKQIRSITSIIPDSFLPDSMSATNLDKTIAKYKVLANTIKTSEKAANMVKEIAPLSQKIDTTATQRIVYDKPQQQQKSKVEVDIKIDSQVPARVEKVKTTGFADLNLDVGNFAISGYD